MTRPRKGDLILTVQGVWYWLAFVKDGWGVMAWQTDDPCSPYVYVRDSDVVARVPWVEGRKLPEEML